MQGGSRIVTQKREAQPMPVNVGHMLDCRTGEWRRVRTKPALTYRISRSDALWWVQDHHTHLESILSRLGQEVTIDASTWGRAKIVTPACVATLTVSVNYIAVKVEDFTSRREARLLADTVCSMVEQIEGAGCSVSY